ncbi:MAG TPA: CHAD domain-containing protein [Bacteroidales bacterium]|nr:CHAD domain-containing protein [Bacteroidales bacterium]HRZ76215.1 CHAD domain-containing protein [Bacteroidales bacterium]
MRLHLLGFYELADRQCRDCLQAYLKEGSPEDLHDLRLGVKKLRVLLGFLAPWDEVLMEKSVAFLELSDMVFRESGRSRDVFLQQVYLGKMELSLKEPYPEYHRYLNALALRRERQLVEVLHQLPLATQLPGAHPLTRGLQGVSGRAMERRFRVEAELRYGEFLYHCGLWDGSGEPEHLHTSRRELKALMYLLQMAGKSKAKVGGRFRSASVLKQIEQVIGTWHDRSEALHRLMLFMKHEPPIKKRRSAYERLECHMADLAAIALGEAIRVAKRVSEDRSGPVLR